MLDNGSTDFEKVYIFGKSDSSAVFSVVQAIRLFWLLNSENGAQVHLPSSEHYTNGYFRIIVVFKSDIRVDAWACISVFRDK